MQTTFVPQVSVSQWLSIPIPVRNELVRIFNVPRSEGSHVEIGGAHNSRATSDGHTAKDLSVITVQKLKEYLKSESDNFYDLFQTLVDGLSQTDQESSQVIARRMNEERLAKWANILAAMKLESKELGLESELNNLLTLTNGENPPKTSQGRKGSRRSA